MKGFSDPGFEQTMKGFSDPGFAVFTLVRISRNDPTRPITEMQSGNA